MLLSDSRGVAGRAAPVPATILIVDDNPVNLQVLLRSLDGRGHRLLVAKDGRTALDIARRVRPDLVLLDVLMPDMGGFEVCTALKADEGTRSAPVIFLSALGEVSDKVAGLSLGAVDYITKPIQPEEVLARVDAHLTQYLLEREVRRAYEQLDRELAGAAGMQRKLLPRSLPNAGRVRFAAHYQTSRHAGGDYFDVLPLGGDRFGVLVLDVSGHGAPAAIVMAIMRTLVHTYPGARDDPAALLRYLHHHFQFMSDAAVYATAIYAVVDGAARTLTVACAGHPLPLRSRERGRVAPLNCERTTPLLLMDLAAVPCTNHALEPGDRLLFYTDGVTDREAASGDAYEVDRLGDALAGCGDRTVDAAMAHLVADIESFAEGQEPHDDNTLLLMEVG
ncbi:MAG TPA: SpoIIE family protein phosphatase [Vicinamibacterales bacterium]|nr:SpoIIE family protein phosphatase [Vicinamibacterales bacterium]